MTDKLKNIIVGEVMKLPKEAQGVISSFGWENIVEEIGRKYLLNESEINDLQAETLTVLIGLTDLDLYVVDIENDIGTTKDVANKIAKEATEKIFIPIGNTLIENIKKSGKDKTANAEQNLDFVLSGGDYSAFVAPPRIDKEEARGGDSPRQYSGEGQGVRSGEVNPIPKKMDDIRSKFTI